MSEAARTRQPIDLEEFERRLRGSAPLAPAGQVSPEPHTLSDYARLMNSSDADAARALAPADPYAPKGYVPNAGVQKASAPAPLDYNDEPVSYAPQSSAPAPYEPYPAFEPPVPQSARPASSDRYSASGSQLAVAPRQANGGLQSNAQEPRQTEDFWDGAQTVSDVAQPVAAESGFGERRLRRPALLIGGVIAVCVVGIGVTLAMRGDSSPGRDAPVIRAASGPVKIQPEQPRPGAQPAQSASILDRNDSERIAASRVVNREEQPIDVREAARAARVEPSRTDQSASNSASSGPAGSGFFPEPRKVKTVSVRPDGSIVSEPAARPPVIAAPPAAPVRAPAVAAPVAPVAAPAPVAPKVTARAAPPVPTIGDNAPRNLAPRNLAAPVAATATATPAAAAGGGAGPFAVQLAAPGSAAEASSTIARLKQRHAAELSGVQPITVRANVNGRDIYRVRVVGMSQDGANALCERLKAGGGSCFVARN